MNETKQTSLNHKTSLLKSKNDLIAVITLLFFYAIFNLLVVNKFFPVTEGWFQDYSRYISEGAVLYKDFYLCVPPGTPLLMFLLSKIFGNIFILYRLFGITERLLLIFVAYVILRKIFPVWISYICLFVSSCVYISNMQDVFYGYYQTSLLWGMLSIYLCIRMYESFEKSRFHYAFLFGVSVIVSFFFKQTLGILLASAIFTMFICGTYYRSIHRCLKNFGFALTGCVAGSIPFFAYFFITHSFTEFIAQVFGGSASKGSITTILFSFLTRIHPNTTILLVLLFFIYFSVVIIRIEKINCFIQTKITNHGLLLIENFIFAAISCVCLAAIFYSITNVVMLFLTLILIILLSILAVMTYNRFIVKKQTTALFILTTGFMSILSLYIILNMSTSFIALSKITFYRRYLIYTIFIILIIYSLFLLYSVLLKRNSKKATELIIVVASWSIMYIHGFSRTIEEHSALLSFAVFVGLILNNIRLDGIRKYKPIKYTITLGLCFFVVFSIFMQRNAFPYNWWGVESSAPTFMATETFVDPNLKGFRADNTSVKVMNDIYYLVNNNRSASGTDTMYTFPHINYFNVMANMDSPAFAKVHYFDVCPDEVAINDANILLKSKPTFIIWMDLDEAIWKTHEDYFRDGNTSGQRSIQKAYQNLTQSGQYECLGVYKLSDYASPIYIWHLI